MLRKVVERVQAIILRKLHASTASAVTLADEFVLIVATFHLAQPFAQTHTLRPWLLTLS